jgi:hypothetical protein
MNFFIDYNLNGHALVLYGALSRAGWLDLVSIKFITFAEIQLPSNSSDRVVWRLAQKNKMILLTANRSMKEKDSLEQVMRQENTSNSLPVITIGNPDRLLNESDDRERCIESLIEIVISGT